MSRLNRKSTAIVFVDCQNDFIGGALGTEEAKSALPNVARLAKLNLAARYRTMDTHGADYLDTLEGQRLPVAHTIQGTPGWEAPEELERLLEQDCLTIQKQTFGAMGLAYAMRDLPAGVDAIVFCGFCTDICVIANALVAQAATYGRKRIVVVTDACAGTTPEAHDAALKVLASCQAELVTTDELERKLDE